jgi:molecular chaperone Hsp33
MTTPSNQDQLQRFLFEQTDVRGEIVHLDQSYQDTLAAHDYPDVVANLLGEFLAAAALFSATLKFEGTISLQARSQGEVPLIMAEATSNHTLRAIAKAADQASSSDFHKLLTDGQLILTVEPRQGKRYQGIVSLDGDNLAQCLEAYFQQSEQLSTQVWLTANGKHAVGMMLQELPATGNADPSKRISNWEHLTHLANTITDEELIRLSFNDLLYRLYNQEQVRVFEPTAMRFKCQCSRTKTLNALSNIR